MIRKYRRVVLKFNYHMQHRMHHSQKTLYAQATAESPQTQAPCINTVNEQGPANIKEEPNEDSIKLIYELKEFSNEEIIRYIDRSFAFWKEKEAEMFDIWLIMSNYLKDETQLSGDALSSSASSLRQLEMSEEAIKCWAVIVLKFKLITSCWIKVLSICLTAMKSFRGTNTQRQIKAYKQLQAV